MNYKRLLCAVLWLTSANTWADWHRYDATAFTTDIEIVFWHTSKAQATLLKDEILSEFERIDKRFSRYQSNSEVSQINKLGAGNALKVSQELFQLLNQAQQVSHLSQGAFDITFASQGYLYDYRQRQQPSDKELDKSAGTDYTQLKLIPESSSVRLTRSDIVIDLGGIAKGYAIDRAILILQNAGVENARIGAGGDMRLLSDKRGKPWIIAIKDPRSESKHAVVLPLSDTALSTSGDYERYFIDDEGERIHHILTPSTGKPAKGIQSVSVIAPDATTSDALSTAVFVMGVKRGLKLINRLPGIEAIIIDEARKLHYSEGLASPKDDF